MRIFEETENTKWFMKETDTNILINSKYSIVFEGKK
jgi:hypothetical protein